MTEILYHGSFSVTPDLLEISTDSLQITHIRLKCLRKQLLMLICVCAGRISTHFPSTNFPYEVVSGWPGSTIKDICPRCRTVALNPKSSGCNSDLNHLVTLALKTLLVAFDFYFYSKLSDFRETPCFIYLNLK